MDGQRISLTTLGITLLLGFAIGFTAHFALTREQLIPLPPPPQTSTPTASVPPGTVPTPIEVATLEAREEIPTAPLEDTEATEADDAEPEETEAPAQVEVAPETGAEAPPAGDDREAEPASSEAAEMQETIEADAPVAVDGSPTLAPEREAPVPTSAETDALWPARHLFISVKGPTLDDDSRALLRELRPGGVVLLGRNIEDRDQTVALVHAIKEAAGLGTDIAGLPLIAVDQEGGKVNRLKLANAPSAEELGMSRDTARARAVGRRYAEAGIDRGIAILFGPVLDVFEPGANTSMATRTFGTERSVVTAMGLAFAQGVMEGGALAVAKHYPGHGAARQDFHLSLAVLDKSIPELAQFVFPFQEAALYGIPGIMVGHIAVPALDPSQPDRPASLSPTLIREILRDRWSYNGVVITDDLATRAITRTHPLGEAVVLALAAGADATIVLDSNPDAIRDVCTAIEQAVAEGRLSEAELTRSKVRLDAWQAWLANPEGLKQPLPELPQPKVLAKGQDAPSTTGGATPLVDSVKPAPVEQPPGTEKIVHLIQPGEMLSRLAVQYGVRQKDILAWNGITDPNLKYGRKLVLYVPREPHETHVVTSDGH